MVWWCILTPRIPGYSDTSIPLLIKPPHNNLHNSQQLTKEARQGRSPAQFCCPKTQTSDLPQLCQYLEISCVFRMKDRLPLL